MGRPGGAPLNVRIPENLKAQLEVRAQRGGSNVSNIVRAALEAYLGPAGEPEPGEEDTP